jgi:hypothetical protein
LAAGFVHAHPSARWSCLRTQLPKVLLSFEQTGVREFRDDLRPSTPAAHLAAKLGVTRATQGGTSFPGSIYVYPEDSPERVTGWVPSTGDPLAEWLSEFLDSPRRRDVRCKLALSGASETHAFVVVPGLVAEAPFAVRHLVMNDDASLPVINPRLPDEITDVWAASAAPTGTCFRWSRSTGWLRVSKLAD